MTVQNNRPKLKKKYKNKTGKKLKENNRCLFYTRLFNFFLSLLQVGLFGIVYCNHRFLSPAFLLVNQREEQHFARLSRSFLQASRNRKSAHSLGFFSDFQMQSSLAEMCRALISWTLLGNPGHSNYVTCSIDSQKLKNDLVLKRYWAIAFNICTPHVEEWSFRVFHSHP